MSRSNANPFVYTPNIPSREGAALFLIDPQNDFMDGPFGNKTQGSLAVAGSTQDSLRTAEFIRKNMGTLDAIYVSMDTHAAYHIAHPSFWRTKTQGVNENKKWETIKATGKVEPWTPITHQSLVKGIVKDQQKVLYVPKDPKHTAWAKKYTALLEKNSNLTLFIWPPHCLIGTAGHNIQPDINDAIQEWIDFDQDLPRAVTYVQKGTNSLTEHYSAFKAEVEIPSDPKTKFNESLYQSLKKHSKIFIGGQATSHCVKHTVEDLVGRMKKDSGISEGDKRICLLKGAMSSVTGFEKVGNDFVKKMLTGKDSVCEAKSILPKTKGANDSDDEDSD